MANANAAIVRAAHFFLSLRRRSGERTEERGDPATNRQNTPPLPGPLLHLMEERERALLRCTALPIKSAFRVNFIS
jgi:hypothetical protein